MNTLEKQQKKGFYQIHVAYETIIEQSVLKGMAHQNEIPTFNRQLANEFSPGKKFLMYLSGLQLVKVVNKNFDALLKISGIKYSKLLGFLHVLLPVEFFNRFYEDIMFIAIFTLDLKNNPMSVLCGDVVLPLWMAKIINMTLARRVEDKMSNKTYLGYVMPFMFNHMKNVYSDTIMSFIDSIRIGRIPGLPIFSSTFRGGRFSFDTNNFFKYSKIENPRFFKKVNGYTFDGLIKDMIYGAERYFLSLRGSLMLYPMLAVGAVVLQHVICRKITKSIMTIEIKSSDFNKVLKALIFFLNEKNRQRNYLEVKREYEESKSPSSTPLSVMAIRVSNKVYEDANDVANQLPLLIKDLLKNLPQNVFVRKVEYFGVEEDDALMRIDTEKTIDSDSDKNNKGIGKGSESDENKESDAYDVVQTLYSTVPSEVNLQNMGMTSVDKNIIKYVRQHYELYRFNNRKTLSRKFLLDALSNRMKPPSLSPMTPHTYEIHFRNETKEPLKLYFYNETRPWFQHVRTIKAPLEERENRKSVLDDIYIVKLSMKQFVEKNLQNVLDDIPKGLSIIEAHKPNDGRDQTCTKYRIFPKKGKQENKGDSCQLPQAELSILDKKFVEALEKMKGKSEKMRR